MHPPFGENEVLFYSGKKSNKYYRIYDVKITGDNILKYIYQKTEEDNKVYFEQIKLNDV
jgi:hypothetical protein